jgi:hypothetical protein
MFGLVSNYENKFFIDNKEIVGIESIDINYANSPSVSKILGAKNGLTTIGAATQQKLSITRNLIYSDDILSYTGATNIVGGIEYDNKSYRFNSGYLDEYMVSCAVGSIPKISTNITIYDEMKIGDKFTSSSTTPTILIPNQGSISATCDNSTTNRVVGFDYAVKSFRKPIYTIGSLFPSEIVSMPILEYVSSVQIDVDDAFLQSGFSFLRNRENKSVSFTINGRNGSLIQAFTIPNASLVGEAISSSADGGIKLTLNYIGHS